MFSKNVFSQRLKKLRTGKNLTLEELGEQLNVAKQTVGHWETGYRLPTIDVVVKIASYFEVSTDYLLGLKELNYENKSSDIPVLIKEEEKKYKRDKKSITSRADKQPGHNKINELIEDLDEESMVELRKYIAYLRIRQTLDSGDDETSAGLDTAENN